MVDELGGRVTIAQKPGGGTIVMLLLPATLVTAILITEVVAMPVVVSVAGRTHPALQKRSGGTTETGSRTICCGGRTQ